MISGSHASLFGNKNREGSHPAQHLPLSLPPVIMKRLAPLGLSGHIVRSDLSNMAVTIIGNSIILRILAVFGERPHEAALKAASYRRTPKVPAAYWGCTYFLVGSRKDIANCLALSEGFDGVGGNAGRRLRTPKGLTVHDGRNKARAVRDVSGAGLKDRPKAEASASAFNPPPCPSSSAGGEGKYRRRRRCR